MTLTPLSKRRIKTLAAVGFGAGSWAQFYPSAPHALSFAEVVILALASAGVIGVIVTAIAWQAARLRRMDERGPQATFAIWFGLMIGLVLGSAVTNLVLNSLEAGGRP